MKVPIDLKDRDNLILYFSLKEKHGYHIDNREEIISNIANEFMFLKNKTIVIPESSSDFLYKVASKISNSVIILKKNSKEYILDSVNKMVLQKQEKASIINNIAKMDSTFKINLLKANQRKKFILYLFCKTDVPENSVLLDDSNFTQSTKQALMYSTGLTEYYSIFSKW